MNEDLLEQLNALAEEARDAERRFLDQHGDTVEEYRQELSRGIVEANDRLRLEVAEISGENPLCVDLAHQTTEYVDWLQWSLWDLPYFAVAIQPDRERFRANVPACAQVYLSGRILDDVFDRHFFYKAKRPTMLSMMAERHASSDGAESLTILSGLLLLSEGLLYLASGEQEEHAVMLRKLLTSLRRTVVGAVLEQAGREHWSPAYYERLIHLKNVDFWRILYTSVDPRRQSPLYPFLERYYALAQKLNDVQDFAEDERRGQPNLLSLHLPPPGNGAPSTSAPAPPAVEAHLAQGLLQLRRRALELPELERDVAMLKLGETLREAFRLGLFRPPPEEPAGEVEAPEPPLSLHWHSTLEEVVERLGVGVLVQIGCPICSASKARRLFERQGFNVHRCGECDHVYVNPRIDLEVQLRMARELEQIDEENEFLEVQRIFAEPICHMLRLRALGPRLLDLGFGRGYILKLARAYGFEVYGLDFSEYLTRRLEPEFGRRLHRATLGVDPIPWDAFDVVVMSHVVEHLADPGAVLREVWGKLRPGGLLFVAVPDIDSLQFQIFGKLWDVVNPLVHFQYFNEGSLSRLLADCGYRDLERIEYPPLPRELTPKWMRLMRDLGGDESGELAMIAQRPAIERLRPDVVAAAEARAEANAAAKAEPG